MTDILGITPPPESQAPDTLSPEVTRDIQRDAMRLARQDAWLNGLIGVAFFAATVLMIWLSNRRPLRLSDAIRPPLHWQFAGFALASLFAAFDAWRAYRRMRAADEASTFDSADALFSGRRWPEERSWLSRRARMIILALVVLSFGYQYMTRLRPIMGPIVFLNATIRTNTGSTEANMMVAVADGRIAFVGKSGDPLPAALAGARQLDAGSAVVSAATFDHTVASPLDGLRHIWVGQLYAGAPGDVVVAPYVNVRGGRGRMSGRMPDAQELLGAVINNRYYSRDDLQKKR